MGDRGWGLGVGGSPSALSIPSGEANPESPPPTPALTPNPQPPAPALIAVGSTNPAKVGAVHHAVARVWPEAAVQGVAVPSGVRDQPRDALEGMRGALLRAASARAALDADLGLGIEGYS